MPNARVSHDAVGLAGASASYHRGGWEDRAARSAVNAAATSAERGAQAVHRDPGREAQGSLDQPNERTSALKRALGRRVGYSPWLEPLQARQRVCLESLLVLFARAALLGHRAYTR